MRSRSRNQKKKHYRRRRRSASSRRRRRKSRSRRPRSRRSSTGTAIASVLAALALAGAGYWAYDPYFNRGKYREIIEQVRALHQHYDDSRKAVWYRELHQMNQNYPDEYLAAMKYYRKKRMDDYYDMMTRASTTPAVEPGYVFPRPEI